MLEVGVVIVDTPSFQVVAEDHWVFHYDIKKPHGYIHPKVVEMHEANGLWQACFRSQLMDYRKMDELVSRMLVDNGIQGAPLAGANPDFDRKFLAAQLPETLKLFHYRSFDTNSFWMLKSFITGEDTKRAKPASHRAVDDCKDAIKVVEDFFEFVTELVKDSG
jgi:oligoribonuclease (3'-5' exoribonuclease)